MRKGISLFFGFETPVDERVKMIKEAGFDTIITSADPKFNYQNGNIRKQMKVFRKYDIQLSSLHMRYNAKDLPHFWEKGKMGNKLEKNLIKDVKIAKKYGFKCVVVHCSGEFSNIGKERFLRVLKVCEKANIPLAIENLLSSDLFVKVFENIKHPYLKFCYDSGHDNCDDNNMDHFKNYGDKLITLHLHDNDGSADQHTLNCVGNIDWAWIAKNLRKYGKDIDLDYEIITLVGCKHLSAKEVLDEVKKQADELEEMICHPRRKRKVEEK